MKATVGSLFSGIGGLDLGLERAGFTIKWNSEIEPYCCKVLAKHWPDVPNLGDVRTIDWSGVERVDLICGGYPCQPFSSVGKRTGVNDPRHLWPWMRDAIDALRPRLVLLENVEAHLSLGFDAVLGDLAALGFDAEWRVISACSVGAPHMRRRLFVVAYPEGRGWRGLWAAFAGISRRNDADREPQGSSPTSDWMSVPFTGPVGVAHGLSTDVDRSRLRALGNAVVPQVAEFIGAQLLNALVAS